MNQLMINKIKPIKLRVPILILTFAAISLSTLNFQCLFFRSSDHFIFFINDNYYISFLPPSLSFLLWILLFISPQVLMVVYILFFNYTHKSRFIIQTIFFLLASFPLYKLACNISWMFFDDRWSKPLLVLLISILEDIFTAEFILFEIPLIIAFILAGISALKGLRNKAPLIISIIIGMIHETTTIKDIIIRFEYYIEEGYYINLFQQFYSLLGILLFLVALLLFGLKNTVNPLIRVSPRKEMTRIEKMPPEQALKRLRENYELGIITEEEYQIQRTEIITKL